MDRLPAIKKLFPALLVISILLSSCDPSSILVVQNHTNEHLQMIIKTRRSIEWFDETYGIDSLFENKVDFELVKRPIPIDKKDSLSYEFIAPPKSTVLVPPGRIGAVPPIEYVIIVQNQQSDTLYLFKEFPSNITLKRSGFLSSEWIVDIWQK